MCMINVESKMHILTMLDVIRMMHVANLLHATAAPGRKCSPSYKNPGFVVHPDCPKDRRRGSTMSKPPTCVSSAGKVRRGGRYAVAGWQTASLTSQINPGVNS